MLQKPRSGQHIDATPADIENIFNGWKISGLPLDKYLVKAGIPYTRQAMMKRLRKAYPEEYEKVKSEHYSIAIKRTYASGRLDNRGINNPRARYIGMSEEDVREIFEDYKKSRLDIKSYSAKRKMTDVPLTKLFKKYFIADYEDVVESHLGFGKNYRKGINFEYRVRDYYREKGYFVLRSPRSLGPLDLVAIRKGEILLIQCKMTLNLSPNKRRELVQLAESIGAKPLLIGRDFNRKIVVKVLS